MKKGLTFFASLLAMALGLAGCGGSGGETYNVSITNKEAISEIFEDDTSKSVTVKIDGVVTADAYQSGDLIVTSSNTSVLEISGNNKLSPIIAGSTTVTATYKNKWSDSVNITVKPQKALQPVSNPVEGEDYVLGMIPSSGKLNYAVGGMDGYYLKSGTKLEDAATAKVNIDNTATGDYKYSISLTWKKDDSTITKTIASCKSEGHINIGFVEDKTEQYPFATALFKVNSDKSLSTMIDGEEFWMGTYKTFYTFSYRNASDIQYKANLYGYLDPIHADSIDINESEVTIKAGGIAQLSATLTPSNSTDIPFWYSKNKSVATIDASTGLIVGVSEGTAEIAVRARPKVEDTITIAVSGVLDYGTTDEPLTVSEAKAMLDDGFSGGEMTPKNLYVTGKVSSATYNSKYSNWTIWLYDGDVAEGFELYATTLDDTLDQSKLVDGAIVKAYGLGKIHTSGSNKIYELTNNGSISNPKVYYLDYTAPALQGIELTPSSVELNIFDGAQTQKFTVKANPEGAELPTDCTWGVLPADEGATIENGLLTVAADAVATGETKEFIVTATVVGVEPASATVTVKNEDEGGGGGGADPIVLNSANLLGYVDADIAYNATESSATVGDISYSFIQLAAYKSENGALRMRTKDGQGSYLFNTVAFDNAITSIDIKLSNAKSVFDNTDVWSFTFGTSASELGNQVKVSTVKDQLEYSVTATGSPTFFRIDKIIASYTFYIESITINF